MDISEIKKAIEGIKAVDSCGITAEDDIIEEIHVVTGYNRNSEQISRDVHSVMISRFGIDIDQSKISVVQLKDVYVDRSEGFRLRLKTIEYSASGGKSEVRVILEKDEVAFEAMVSGSNTKFNTQRILSTAALKATERFLEREDLFTFEDVRTVTVAGAEVVVVSVVVMEDGSEKRLFGCAQADRDMNEAVVKATLNAINRKVSVYLES